MTKIFITCILSVFLLVISCAPLPPEKSCTTAADCVPAACCHAQNAVNQEYKPDCSETLCTAVCEPRTLDCGQGEIQCVRGECTVVLTE